MLPKSVDVATRELMTMFTTRLRSSFSPNIAHIFVYAARQRQHTRAKLTLFQRAVILTKRASVTFVAPSFRFFHFLLRLFV